MCPQPARAYAAPGFPHRPHKPRYPWGAWRGGGLGQLLDVPHRSGAMLVDAGANQQNVNRGGASERFEQERLANASAALAPIRGSGATHSTAREAISGTLARNGRAYGVRQSVGAR